MLTVGDTLPCFNLSALVSMEPGRELREVSHGEYAGKWLVLFFWPLSFTKTYPPELADFARRHADFKDRNAEVVGATTDAPYVHLAWRKEHPALQALPYPVLADYRRDLARRLGVLNKQEAGPLRATFIFDPEGVIRWAAAGELPLERSASDILRVLDTLQAWASKRPYGVVPESIRPPASQSSIPAPSSGVRGSEGALATG